MRKIAVSVLSILFALLSFVLFQPLCFCEASNQLYDIRYWSSPSSTRIVLDLKDRPLFNAFTLRRPERLVVDLKNFKGTVPKTLLPIGDGIVKRVRASVLKNRVIRVVVDLEKFSAHRIFPLKRFQNKPHRLVIDITRSDLENANRLRREKTRKLKKRDHYIVVIDPGHGGEDPGAIGRGKTREKDIALSIAKKIRLLFNRRKGIQAFLTRKADYFIPLNKRISIAEEYGADLFISIHADSSFSKRAHGSSVYCLSLKGASSNTARMLAKKENASDYIGGVPIDYTNNDLNAIIFDLVQTHSLNSSLQCAGFILKELARVNKLHSRKPHQASFRVLRAPDIPSILVETDFISNPKKERMLRSEKFQNRIASAITSGVWRFLAETKGRQKRASPQFHTVKKGETLYSIAKKYNTTINKLRKLNGLNVKGTLRIGTKLRVS